MPDWNDLPICDSHEITLLSHRRDVKAAVTIRLWRGRRARVGVVRGVRFVVDAAMIGTNAPRVEVRWTGESFGTQIIGCAPGFHVSPPIELRQRTTLDLRYLQAGDPRDVEMFTFALGGKVHLSDDILEEPSF